MSGFRDRDNSNNVCNIHIKNINPEITTKAVLKQIFEPYGEISKIFYNGSRPFANVCFTTAEAAKHAVNDFKTNTYNWSVMYGRDSFDEPTSTAAQSEHTTHQSASHHRDSHNSGDVNNFSNDLRASSNTSLNGNSDDMDYAEDLLTFNDDDYVDVHGRNLTVLTSPEGQMFIPLHEIRRTGFAIFRKDNYESLLISNNQLQEEFVMHLLAEGKNFLLRNQVRALDENKITEAIAKAQELLLNHNTSRENGPMRDVQDAGNRTDSRGSRGQFQDTPTSKSTPISHNRENAREDRDRNDNRGRNDVRGESRGRNDVRGESRGRNDVRGESRGRNDVRDERRSYDNRNPRQSNQRNFSKPDSRFQNDFGNKKSERVIENKGENGLTITAHVQPSSSGSSGAGGDNSAAGLRKPHQNLQSYDEMSRNTKYETVSKPVPQKPSTPILKEQPKVATAAPAAPVVAAAPTVDQSVELSSGYLSLRPDFQEVTVTFVESSNVFWLSTNPEDMATIILDAADSGPTAKRTDPVVGQIFLAEFCDSWYRAVVLQLNPLKVLFVDFGNVDQVDNVRTIPKQLADFPAQAIKVQIEDVCGKELKEDMTLIVKPIKKLGANYFLVTLKDAVNKSVNKDESTSVVAGKAEPTESSKPADVVPKSPSCFGKPGPLETLSDGKMVMILEEKDRKFVVVTRNCYTKGKEIAEKLLNYQGEQMTNPSKNQLVVVKHSSGYRRAVITNLAGSSVEVEFVDHPGSGFVTRSDIRAVDNYLGFEPSTVLVTPQLRINKPLSAEARNWLQELIDAKKKFSVKIDGDTVDLQFDNLSLTKEINRIDGASGPSKATIHDVTFHEVKNGVGDFMVASVRGASDIVLLSMGDEVSNALSIITTLNIPNEPYVPDIEEVCLGLYEDEWYRCAVLERKGNSFDVLFLDYGNSETLTTDNLRKLPDNMRDMPIFGLTCSLKDVPADNKKIDAELVNLLPCGDTVQADLFKTEDETYVVKIDSVTSQLKKLGLL